MKRNYTTVDSKQFVFLTSEHSATRVCDQSWETKECKAEAEIAVESWETHVNSRIARQRWIQQSRAGRQVQRIERPRRTQQSELGDKCIVQDCKAEAGTAAERM